jgi:quinol-cytochrome oxidoreductase complex cytochrome b subunit
VVATAVGTGLPTEIPLVGPYITEFFRGGSTIGSHTLPRFFALHVSMLPMIVGLALGFHIVFIRRHGMRRPPGPLARRVTFYPDFILRQGLVCVWVFTILLTAAILWPSELRPEGNLMAPAPEGIKPEWYFLAAFELIKWGGRLTCLTSVGVTAELLSLILLGGAVGVFALMPKLDRRGTGHVWRWIVSVAAVAFVGLTFYAMFKSTPGVEAVNEVADQTSEHRIRTLGFLVPFALSAATLSWLLVAQIRVHNWISASQGSRPIGRKH